MKDSNMPENRNDDYTSDENLPILERFRAWRVQHQEKLKKNPLLEWTELVVSIIVIVFLIRLVVVEAFRIPTSSMEDTLLVGDFLLVNKFVYGIRTPDWVGVPFTRAGFFVPFLRTPSFKEPEPGDIIVFRYPRDPNLAYIKRCIAVAGQTVEIRDKQVFIDGELFTDPPFSKFSSRLTLPKSYVDGAVFPRDMEFRNRDNYGPITVPEGNLFCMGDNRDNSLDSRYWGFLPRDKVIGQALLIYFSFDKKAHGLKLNKKIRWDRIGNLIK